MPNNAFEADPPSRRAPSPDGALILRVQTLENEIKEALKQRNRADKIGDTMVAVPVGALVKRPRTRASRLKK